MNRNISIENSLENNEKLIYDSWEVLNDKILLKTVDKSIFIHNGTGVPMRIRHYFDLSLEKGESKTIKLLHKDKEYLCNFELDKLENPRSRIKWKKDFGDLIKNTLPGYYEMFNENNEIPEINRPKIKFEKYNNDSYLIDFIIPDEILHFRGEEYESMRNKGESMDKRQVMHIILKYNNSVYNVDTIKEHQNIIEKSGKGVWGIIKPSENSPGVGGDKVIKIKNQISQNIDTWAFFVTGGKVNAKGKIIDILSKEEVAQKRELVPIYYQKDLDRCVSGILLEDIIAENPDVINKFERYGTEGGSVAVGNQTNPLYISIVEESEKVEKNKLSKELVSQKNWETLSSIEIKNYLSNVTQYINSIGFIYEYNDLSNFYLSLKTKPFVILAGISGTGKSRLTRLFAESLGANNNNERFRMISVKPDWNDSADLFGYRNITDKFIKGILTETIEDAIKNKDLPYFICLDEMNLARVEYYFSEYLSLIESRKRKGQYIESDYILNGNSSQSEEKLYLPENLYIVGTVNMDDTTFGFSRKVLDRANTIEFNDVNLSKLFLKNEYLEDKGDINIHNDFLKSNYMSPQEIEEEYRDYAIQINKKIAEINDILKRGKKHFGYRVREEILYYMVENKKLDLLDENVAFDYQFTQKILPLINGSQAIVKDILVELFNISIGKKVVLSEVDYLEDAMKNLDNAIYKKSASKIIEMLRGYKYDGFATFWF